MCESFQPHLLIIIIFFFLYDSLLLLRIFELPDIKNFLARNYSAALVLMPFTHHPITDFLDEHSLFSTTTSLAFSSLKQSKK